jgi:hypothetical protein
MDVTLIFVPPGGGETDYAVKLDLPAVPRAGDYINLARHDRPSDAGGIYENFIVRRTWWEVQAGADGARGTTMSIAVECEFALSPFSTDSHRRSCEMYRNRGKNPQEFEETAY